MKTCVNCGADAHVHFIFTGPRDAFVKDGDYTGLSVCSVACLLESDFVTNQVEHQLRVAR